MGMAWHRNAAHSHTGGGAMQLDRQTSWDCCHAYIKEPTKTTLLLNEMGIDEEVFDSTAAGGFFRIAKSIVATHGFDTLNIPSVEAEAISKFGRSTALEYMQELCSNSVAEYSAEVNFAKLQNAFLSNRIIKTYENYSQDLSNGTNASEVASTLQYEFSKIAGRGNKTRRIEEVCGSVVESMGGGKGIASMHFALNNVMRYYGLVIIAARPSCGKTALLCNEAEYWCDKLDLPVAIASLEMTAEELVSRIACKRADVNSFRLCDGSATDEEWDRIHKELERISQWPLYINDRRMTNSELQAWLLSICLEKKIAVAGVDYLQLIRPTKDEWRIGGNERVGKWTSDTKETFKRTGTPILMLSQLSRYYKPTTETPPLPQLEALRDSGCIEQDADMVMFLSKKPGLSLDQFEGQGDWPIQMYVAKQRNGPLGVKDFYFIRDRQRFEHVSTYTSHPRYCNDPQGF